MSSTFLSHSKGGCNGNIVIDVSTTAKLVAPSFSVHTGGLTSLVMDIKIQPGNSLTPVFECTKCGEVVPAESLNTGVAARCQICGKTRPANELYVHHQVTCLCEDCLSQIRNPETCTSSSQVPSYIEAFGLSKNTKVVSLVKVLTSPIEL